MDTSGEKSKEKSHIFGSKECFLVADSNLGAKTFEATLNFWLDPKLILVLIFPEAAHSSPELGC